MKIYINTSTEPPTLSSALSVRTAADGALQVFNASGGGAVSQLRFKRGTTVPLTVLFPLEEIPADGADAKGVPSEMTFAVKLSGKYDDVPVLRASSTEATTPSTGADAGFARFEMKAEIASSLIDAALGVGGNGTADDLESAAFMAELSWTNADGETSASATIPTQILNNVFRDGDAAAGANPGGDWAALIVVRKPWAEYCALEEKADDVIYVCPDAPREVEEHNADESAHPALVQALTKMIQTLLENVQLDDATATRILAELSELRAAARAASENAAAVRTEMNTDFAKFEAGTSTAETGAKHGKSLLASQNGENGGFYAAANKSATRAWTQYLTRYQQDGVRAYGAINGEYENYLWAPRTAEDEPLRVARLKDFDRIVNPTLVVSTEGEKTEEPNENANMTAWVGTLGALKGLEADDATAIVPDAVSVWRRTAGTTVNATLNMRMKIMRWDEASGAWAIAAKSKETRVWSNFANGEEIPFTFAWEGDGIPANEKVIIGFVRMSEEDTAGTFTQASCAQTTTRGGAMTVAPGLSTREPAVQAYAPVMRLSTARVLTPAGIEALIADAESGGGGSGGGGSGVTEEWVRNNFVPSGGEFTTSGAGTFNGATTFGGEVNVQSGKVVRFRNGEGNTAVSLRFTDSPTGGVLNQGSATTTTAMTWMSGNYMSWFSSELLRMYSGESVVSPTAKVEVNPNGVILAAGAGDAAKIVIDAGKIQVSGVALTLNVAPTAANHAATKGYVDEKVAALEARIAALEGA